MVNGAPDVTVSSTEDGAGLRLGERKRLSNDAYRVADGDVEAIAKELEKAAERLESEVLGDEAWVASFLWDTGGTHFAPVNGPE